MTNDSKGNGKSNGDEKKPLVEYPTDYEFKVMGRQAADFQAHVEEIFTKVLGEPLKAGAVKQKPSSKSTYLSLSVTVYLTDEIQRMRIYDALHADDRIIYHL